MPISPRHVRQLTREVGTAMVAARDAQAEGKDDGVACLATLATVAGDADPCPEPPPPFVEPRRVQRLVAPRKGAAGEAKPRGTPADVGGDTGLSPATPESEPGSPRRLVRTCAASLRESRSFGPLVAAEARSRNFYAAGGRAFVADGAAYNGAIRRGYFPDFEPIAHLPHVACCLFGAAQAVGVECERWPLPERWWRAVWRGRVADVVKQLEDHQEESGRPPPGEELAASAPRRVVAGAVPWLVNTAGRMDYPRYRRVGLPATSSSVESLVGGFDARVKGRSKFWNRPDGAEGVLQVRAALLSEDGRLERYLAQRPGRAFRRHAA